MKDILTIKDLSKSYKNVRAIQHLDLEIEEGQAYGILGPNGSGKTTTLSIITGIIRQDSGSYSWFGLDPDPAQRRSIGSLIETPHFYPYLNLEKNLRIICDIKGISYQDIGRVLETANLEERKRSRFSTLSLGMKQRLGIAAALLGDPRVLVLDEPTNGLDPEGIAEVREVVIDQVKNGITLILASHILSEVEKICSHVAVLKKGELLARGPVKELLAEDEIIEVACGDNVLLREKLEESKLVKEVVTENGMLILTLNETVSASDINSFAFSHKLVIHHMLSRKRSLESQFLELVK
ncbi:MAG: ABC transporter ATP-binding protein, partial [Bacteroidales bacterium]